MNKRDYSASENENSLLMDSNEIQTQECKWCKSEIIVLAKFCTKCGLWQSSIRQWLLPSTLLSLVGALAAWSAVVYQVIPKDPNPILLAAQAVEAFEFKAEEGCENNKTNNCLREFWYLSLIAEDTRSKVPNLDVRKELRNRIEIVIDNHGYKYAQMYEFEPLD